MCPCVLGMYRCIGIIFDKSQNHSIQTKEKKLFDFQSNHQLQILLNEGKNEKLKKLCEKWKGWREGLRMGFILHSSTYMIPTAQVQTFAFVSPVGLHIIKMN